MQDPESQWLAAAADLQADMDADVRAEAFEVFVAEAARARLADRVGSVRVSVRCGHVVIGDLDATPEGEVAGHLQLVDVTGRRLLIPAASVLVMTGSRPGLRAEEPSRAARSITARLREAWILDESVRALLVDGRSVGSRLLHVGADHVELDEGATGMVVALGAVDVWVIG